MDGGIMKRTIKNLAVIFMMVIAFCLVAMQASAADASALTFTACEGGVMVSGCNTSAEGALTIPAEYNGQPVVGLEGFNIHPALINVTIPDTIKYISADTFGPLVQYNEYGGGLYLGNEQNPYVALIKAKSNDITSCKIHPRTSCIADGAFDRCGSLTSITFGGEEIPSYNYAYINSLSILFNKK